jgi:oligopeptide/dipeptide ABC transporter ATP-binding protein
VRSDIAADRPALDVQDLTVSVRLRAGGRAKVVDGVSFSVPAGGTLGIVGESGSGKTMTSLAIMGLLPRAARVDSGRILLDGDDLLQMDQGQLRKLRGSRIGMILQDPMTALDPSFTIGSQLEEPLRQHRHLSGAALEEATVTALTQVHLPAAKDRLAQYPHQLSGGMRQRVTSAIALAGQPGVLIADEPTTALDVTTQARYLQLLEELQATHGFALLLVTHDLYIVRHVCSRVVVMYGGRVVEQGAVDQVFAASEHPYTRALLGAIPIVDESTVHLESIDGQAPDLGERVEGCNFAPRCRYAREACTASSPALTARTRDQAARCFGTEADGWIA